MRKRVLREEPYCPGFPLGIHGDDLVPTEVADHVVSVRRGGGETRDNYRGLCRACNSRKAVAIEGARPRRRR